MQRVARHATQQLFQQQSEPRPLWRAERRDHDVDRRATLGKYLAAPFTAAAGEAQCDCPAVMRTRPAFRQPVRNQPIDQPHRAGVAQAQYAAQGIDGDVSNVAQRHQSGGRLAAARGLTLGRGTDRIADAYCERAEQIAGARVILPRRKLCHLRHCMRVAHFFKHPVLIIICGEHILYLTRNRDAVTEAAGACGLAMGAKVIRRRKAMDNTSIARWRDWSGAGIEHLALRESPQGLHAESVVVADEDGQRFAARYHVACDSAWQARTLDVSLVGDDRRIAFASDGSGHWRDATGRPIPEFDGAIDVDITATPFTNTLPIRRLELHAGQSATLRVVHVRLPDFTVTVSPQRYTCLEPLHRYRFESLGSGFMREIEVDAAGLVVTYPDLFRRLI